MYLLAPFGDHFQICSNRMDFVGFCRDCTLQEIVEMQLLEDQQAARFVAAWLEIRMLELGTG